MKQAEMRKFLQKQGAKLNKKIIRILHPYYKPDNVEAEVRGSVSNEIKSALIKRGYDIFCSQCGNHFSFGHFSLKTKCSRCGFSWRTDMRGRPA